MTLLTWQILVFTGIVFTGVLIQSVVGFGGNFFATGLLALFLPVHEVIIALALVITANNLLLILLNRQAIQWDLIRRIAGPVVGGVILGAFALPVLPENIIQILLGVVIIVLNGYEFYRRKYGANYIEYSALVTHSINSLGAVIQGAVGTGGPLIVTTMANRLRTPSAFRGTINVILLLMNGIRSLMYGLQGQYEPVLLKFSLLGVLPLLLAATLGHSLALRLKDAHLRRMILWLLIGIGTAILVKALLF